MQRLNLRQTWLALVLTPLILWGLAWPGSLGRFLVSYDTVVLGATFVVCCIAIGAFPLELVQAAAAALAIGIFNAFFLRGPSALGPAGALELRTLWALVVVAGFVALVLRFSAIIDQISRRAGEADA
jgi:hypothetical protein